MKIYLSIILFLIPLSTFGKDRYHFSKLSLESGLSQITVTCIHEDKKGFMWFGTRNGLNRFDGYRFDVYTTDLENNTSISDNHVQCVAEDAEGNLWVGTSNGLNRLDKGTEKFKRYFYDSANPASLSNNTITAIYFDTNNNLWIGTRDGLNLYNKATNSFDRIAIDNLLINNPVNAIVRKDDILYIGTFSQGLIAYNIADKQYKVYKNNPDDMKSLSHNHIRAIAIDRNGNLWVGTYHDGVNLLRKGENSFSFYNTKNGLTDDYVRCIAESPQGEILVGTFNGLNSIDPKTGEITQYKTYGSNEGDLSHYSIQSIYFDRSQTLWVGTYAGGINYYSRFGQKFRFFDPGSDLRTILGIIGPSVETSKSIYFATEGGGLLEMDKDTERFNHYKILGGTNTRYGHNILKSLYLDGNSILCGTTLGTIYSFDLNTKTFFLIHDFKRDNGIYYLGKRANGDLIVGGVNQIGLTFISQNGQIKDRFPMKGEKDFTFQNVRCVLEIETDVFLIGTRSEGLYYYNFTQKELRHYKNNPSDKNGDNLPENYVTGIFKDSLGNIWIGTFGGGISLFNVNKATFKTYNTKNGLQDNNICAIIEDNNKHLWISTISGISDLDLLNTTIKNYAHASGIKVNEFTTHAGLKLSDNNIVFSGNNGFTVFNPRQMAVNPFIPSVVFKDLYINNNKIIPDGKDGILKSALDDQREIVLKYNEANIAIEYSALNYIFSNQNQYSYKLEGFDEDWNNVGSRRIAYYTNIPPGKYRFIVKGSNNDEVWNNEGAILSIAVLPPFWKTWWAYLTYMALFIGLMLFIFRYFNERKRLENDIKIKQAEAKAQEEFHQARNKLFTNFSHELRTPLTLILSPLEDMVETQKDLPAKVKNNHLLMHNNALRMLRLVNNLMDFQKKESGSMKLKVSKTDFIQFTDEMVSLFNEMAESRHIALTFNHSVKTIDYWFDKNLMEKVYFNFLSNAFKNTPDYGVISVDIALKRLDNILKDTSQAAVFINHNISYIVLEIKDSGVGIPADQLEDIFIPFYQVAQNEHSVSGTGLGLSLSKSIIEMHHGVIWAETPLDGGALFKCILPVSTDYFEEKDIADNFIEEDFIPYSPQEREEQIDGQSKKKKTYTLLIVEDNKDVRSYIISHLSDDYNIIESPNGADAVDKAINSQPDLIITDLMMPKMNGVEMSAIIKKDIRTSHIPVIMLTAKAMPSDMKEGYETGADDYITKPFSPSVLRARVQNIIQAREKLKEIYGKKFSLESLGVETTSLDEQFMQKLYNVLQENVANPEFNLESFSRDLGMSKASLYRKIKAITNLSPNEYIRNFRLEMGAKLLREAKLPVSDVYVAVGFSSIGYFSTCFKAYFGVSPTEYAGRDMKE